MIVKRLLLAFVIAAVAFVVGCGGSDDEGDSGSEPSGDPIKLGTSLPLTGEFSEPGKASERGYQVWEKMVNDAGGILGRPVEVVVLDDASKQNIAVTDYTNLISQEKVDLLLGTFSSILNLPASAVAERNQMVFACPACASPDMYERGFEYLFYAKQALAPDEADQLAQWLLALPENERPKTAAFVSQDDPFTVPLIDGLRERLEAGGIETVYNEIYPPETRNFDTMANAISSEEPDIVAQGSLFEDAVGLVRSLIKADYSPDLMFQSSAPVLGEQYADAIGPENTEGMMTATAWAPEVTSPGNKEFVAAYKEMFDGEVPGEESASAFGTAQVMQAAAEAVGSVDDQKALADWLHANEVETILGTLSWDEAGRPKGEEFIAQWQNDRIEMILPEQLATADNPVFPKPDWGGK